MRTAVAFVVALAFLSVLTNEPPTHKAAVAQAISKPVAVVVAPKAPEPPPKPVEVPTPVIAPVAAPVVAPVSTNAAKMYIYTHESGNNPASVNSIGCRGLGQACPGTKLPCGADYACQDAWFTQYMLQRYGSWENAYQFWILHHWW